MDIRNDITAKMQQAKADAVQAEGWARRNMAWLIAIAVITIAAIIVDRVL